MAYLIAVSLVWAFSFGLIKNRLLGLDPTAVGTVRLAFALLVFLPFLRLRGTSFRDRMLLGVTGMVQFGVMYIVYLHAFRYLQAYEIALFTITTPLYLAVFDAALERRIQPKHWVAACLSVAGAGVLVWQNAASDNLVRGIVLVQISNACFAAGQLAYRRLRRNVTGVSDASVFAWLYVGALIATGTASVFGVAWANFSPTPAQWATLAYLGILSSGLCFFWWNRGATLVNAGTLAALNNAKVPLGVACSLLFFGEEASWPRLLMSGSLLGIAVLVAEHKTRIKSR